MTQEDPTRIKYVKGVLCHTWSPSNSPDTVYEQIVLPRRIMKYKQKREQAKEELRSRQATEEQRRQKDQEQQAMTQTLWAKRKTFREKTQLTVGERNIRDIITVLVSTSTLCSSSVFSFFRR